MKSRKLFAAVLVLAAGAALGAGTSDDGVKRESLGQKRAAHQAMELKAFDAANWSLLSGWTNGEALTAENTAGKVVLIGSWASWSAASTKQLGMMQSLADSYKNDGLIVVGVHHKEGFADAAATMTSNNATFLTAHDAENKFRGVVQVDQDPDFFVIDRAGNMRFADIATGAVEKAVGIAMKETAEDATKVPGDTIAAAAAAVAESHKTIAIKGGLKPGQVLNVAFEMPKEELYKDLKWPEQNNGQLSANNAQGQKLSVEFGNEQWVTDKPVTKGRVVVIDFWATWCGPCKRAMPMLDDIQKEYRQDLCILGISDEELPKVKRFIDQNRHDYYIGTDPTQTISASLEVKGIPHMVVMSTDGVIRWQGNPFEEGFKNVIRTVIETDPGVKARRAAEEAYLKKVSS